MSKHRHVTHCFCATCNAWHNHDVRIYDLYGLKAHSNVLSNNLCHIHVTISKIGCHRLTQQHWHACTNEILEIWKLHILWHNFIKCARIFFKPSEQTFFIQTILMRGTNPMLTPKLHTSEIWSKLKKWNISLNFWVNIGMWPIIFMWLTMPNVTVMSEYMIYMVWKLIVMFCPITCVTSMWQFQKLVVTG